MEHILDFTVLYNTADSESQKNYDTNISLRFVEKLVKNAKSWGLVKPYYSEHDCIPGTDIFEELGKSIQSANTIVVVVTKGFLKNHWESFAAKMAFKSFLDLGESGFVVPILLGTDVKELPDFLKINYKNVYFSLDGNEGWIEEERMWHKIRTLITFGTKFPPNAGKRGIQETQLPASNTTDDGTCSARQSNANWTNLGAGQTHGKQPQEHANNFSDINDHQLQLAIEMSLRETEKKAETPDDLEYDHPNEHENDAVNIYKEIDYTDLEGTNVRELLHAVTSGIKQAFNWFT